MADDIRQRIIASVFSTRSASGSLEQTYIAHLKIYEDDGPDPSGANNGGKKVRYVLLGLTLKGPALVYKSRMNANGAFSIGKKWDLKELKNIEALDSPGCRITFTNPKPYIWETDGWEETETFVQALVRIYRRVSAGNSPQVVGFKVPDRSTASMASRTSAAVDDTRSYRSPTPPVPFNAEISRRRPPMSTISGYSESPPLRSVSPANFPPRQSSNLRSTSPASRGMLASQGKRSFESSITNGTNGRVPDLPNGNRRTPSPSSSRTYLTSGTSLESRRSPSQRSPQAPQKDPEPLPSVSRTPLSNNISLRREKSGTLGRSPGNGLPSNPRRAPGGSRSERAPSPPPDWDIPPQTSRTAIFGSTRSDRAPSPNGYPNGVVPRRPRGASRSERAPSPEEDIPRRPRASSRTNGSSPYNQPPEPLRQRSRAGSRADRPPSPSSFSEPRRRPDPSPSRDSSRVRGQPELADPRVRPPLPTQSSRKDPSARVSFFDPTNQASADRLLATINDRTIGEEESAEATLANVEEMLDGYEWAIGSSIGGWGDSKGAADQIEARLLKELSALEAANMYSFVESDDRVNTVLKFIDDALKELEDMDGNITSYKIHLNAVTEDISFVQSQNRGLQVQTQNQRALLKELEDLVQTVQVDREALIMLTNQSLEKRSGLTKLEEAAAELYKALLAGRDTDMAATMERLEEYRTYNQQFCQRILDFLPMMISYQADSVLKDQSKPARSESLILVSHKAMEDQLQIYSGLVRYVREMDEVRYGKLCAAYFGTTSQLYNDQTKLLFDACLAVVRKATDEESELNFGPPSAAISRGVTMRRAGTMVRSPLDLRSKDKEKDRDKKGELRGYEAFGRILDQLTPVVIREEEFLSIFLQLDETGVTFADYMNLDSYFRRQASRSAGLSRETQKLLRGAMDLIFSFLPDGIKRWIDDALEFDKLQMIGIIAHLERYKSDAEERGNAFLARLLQKQQQRMVGVHTRHLEELIKSIEQTKATSKKRKGVAQYIKYFPIFVNRVESQMTGADSFEIRTLVDTSYEKLVDAMFESLQQIAKLDGEGEDKGQLTYHVVLIENMYCFFNELSQQSLGSVSAFCKRAEAVYEENLNAYVKLLMRKFFVKLIDFLEGAEKALKTSSAAEVSSNANYNKSQLKKVIKDTTAKDVKRNVDSLFKRVEKHFAEDEGSGPGVAMPGTVLAAVWKACEEELLRVTERFNKLLAAAYKDSTLEYSVGDVDTAFRKHRA